MGGSAHLSHQLVVAVGTVQSFLKGQCDSNWGGEIS